MKIVFDDKSEMELNEDEQVAMSAMLACYAAVASRNIEDAAITVMLSEMRYGKETRNIAKRIGEKLVLDAAAKKGYSEEDLVSLQKQESSTSDKVKELFK